MRDCGDCSLCCKVIHVESLRKPAGTWCQHCSKGSATACQIFRKPERPYECGKFQCTWTKQYDWPEMMKPSKSRMVFEDIDSKILLVTCDPDMPSGWKESLPIKRFLKKLALGGKAVVIRAGKETHTLLPRGMTNEQVWDKLRAEYDRWQHQRTPTISPP